MLKKIYVISLLTAFSANSAWADLPSYENFIVFGDSLSDTGNRCRGEEDDETLCILYPDGKFSDENLWVEHLADRMGLEIIPSSRGGNNFAFAGATSGPGSKEVPGLTSQFRSYLDRIGCTTDPTGCKADPNALYAIWIGGNDVKNKMALLNSDNPLYRTLLKSFSPTSKDIPFKDLLEDIANTVTRLSRKGARHFLIPNLPPVHKTPVGQALVSGFVSVFSKLDWLMIPDLNTACESIIEDYNWHLSLRLKKLEKKWNVNIHHPDAFHLFENVAENYTRYNLNSPNELAYIDFFHPSAKGHKIIADHFTEILF